MTSEQSATAPAEIAAQKPVRRNVSRKVARRISIVRDVLASLKDLGIIAGVCALLFFHETVSEFLQNLNPNSYSGEVVDLQRSLSRLSRSADTQAVTSSHAPTPAATVSSPATTRLPGKLLRAEQRLLRSEDAHFIIDWVVVVATTNDYALAEQIGKELAASSKGVAIANKANRNKVLVHTGTPEETQSVLNRTRLKYPTAVSVSLEAWCSPADDGKPVISCRRK